MKKDAYYFPHDSNAKDDPKCVMLIEQLGLEGYGIYWVLIETLRDQPEYKYPLALIPAIARRYNSTQEKVKTVVQNYGLFSVKDDMFFYSESLIERMIPLQNQREKASLAGKKSGAIRSAMSNTPFEEKSELPQLYIIKCFDSNESFIKIGTTNGTISRRFSGKLPYDYSVLKQVFTTNYLSIESEINSKFNRYKYHPSQKFQGAMECYCLDIVNDVLEFIDNKEISQERRLSIAVTSVQPVEYSKVEYSKVKESKVKKNNIVSIETRKKDFYDLVSVHKDSYSKEMLRCFFDYWTEPSTSGLKMRFEAEKFFDMKRRLTTWDNNNKEKFASKQDLSTKKGINGSDGTVSLLMSARVK